jgi:hypothetical protein
MLEQDAPPDILYGLQRRRGKVDIKEGNPAAAFSWFFDTDQGTKDPNEYLFILYGSSGNMNKLVKECFDNQESLNDALGNKILLLFFNPTVKIGDLFDSGQFFNRHVDRVTPTRFLFSGYGEAYSMPPGMIELGTSNFRSELPGEGYFKDLSEAAARAHTRAIPFFQQAFGLRPRTNGIIVAHRTMREIRVYEISEGGLPNAAAIRNLFVAIRGLYSRTKGEGDIETLNALILGCVDNAALKRTTEKVWETLRKALSTQPATTLVK